MRAGAEVRVHGGPGAAMRDHEIFAVTWSHPDEDEEAEAAEARQAQAEAEAAEAKAEVRAEVRQARAAREEEEEAQEDDDDEEQGAMAAASVARSRRRDGMGAVDEGGPVLSPAGRFLTDGHTPLTPLVWAPSLASPLGTPLRGVGLRLVNRTEFYRCKPSV